MSILDRFKPKTAADAQKVTPSDAPESKAPDNAKPVEGFQAVPPSRAEVLAAAKANIKDVPAPAPAPDDGLDDEERAALAAIRKKKEEKAAKEKAAAEAAAKKEAEAAAKKARDEAAKKEEADAMGTPESEEEKEVRKSKGGRPPGSPNKPKELNTVTASYGVTMNIGDFNSVRIDASFSDKCEAGEMSETYDALLDMAKAKVEVEMRKVAAGTKS